MYKNRYSNSGRSFGRSGGGNSRPQRRGFRSSSIKHEMYISEATNITVSEENMYDKTVKFSDFPLHEKILANITARNYINPTKIQAQVIKPILDKKDVIGLASTGSGKTAAFLIPVLDALLKDYKKKCLVIAPTRELVNQIQSEFKIFAFNTFVKDVLVVGGASYYNQRAALKRNHQIVIATPGRIIDLYNRKDIFFEDFDVIILDEVDQMLDMGFINDIKLIISKLKPTRQSLFFSATMDNKIREIAKTLLHDPITVESPTQLAVKNVDQSIIKVDPIKGKIETLHELLIKEEFQKVLVFSRTKYGSDRIAESLRTKGHKVDALHGNKSLGQRTKILSMFRKDEIKILVATDVASRGIDIPDISHVINYDEPATYEDYVHRIGRTGRIGKKGTALTFI